VKGGEIIMWAGRLSRIPMRADGHGPDLMDADLPRKASVVSASPRNAHGWWLLPAVLVVCGLVAGACDSAAPTAPARPLSPAGRLWLAEEILISRCMAAHGFRYAVTSPAGTVQPPTFPYGIDDVAWARVHGYGLADQARLAERQRDNPNARYTASLPASRQAVYNVTLDGSPTHRLSVTVPNGLVVTQSADGCLAAAEARLYGNFAAWFRDEAITGNLLPAIQPKVYADPRFRHALAAWSACVRAAGHPAATPDDLRNRAAAGGPAVGRDLAVTDATCNRKAGLAATGQTLDRQLGAPVRARYRAEIQACARLRLAALRRAAAVIRSTTPAPS